MSSERPPVPRADDRLGPILERYLLHGDEEAVEEIVRRTRPRLLAAARRIGKPQDAEDAVQSAYFSLLRKRGGRLEAPVLPWLMTAVIRIAYRQKAKKDQRQHELARRLSRPARTGSPLPEIANAEEAERMRQEIARLPAKYRDPVVLRHLQGLSTAEASELLGIPEPTVRTRLFRAREILKSRWPVKVAFALLFIPWLLKDTARNAWAATNSAVTAVSLQTSLALVVVAAAGTLGAVLGSAGAPDSSVGGVPSGTGAVNDALKEREQELSDAVAEARRERVEAERSRRRAEEALAALLAAARPIEAGPGAVAVLVRRRAPVPGAGDAALTGTVDWRSVGEAIAEIVVTVQRIYNSVVERREPTAEDRGRVQQLSGLLVREVSHLGGGVPANIINHRYGDPDFMFNALGSALEVVGKPLNSDQIAALAKEAASYWHETAIRRSDFREETPHLTRLLGESKMKEELLQRVFRILTPAQRDVLSPEGIRGRMHLDMFGGGIVFNGKLRMMAFETEAGLEVQVTELVSGILELSEAERRRAAPLFEEYVRKLPEEIRNHDAGTYERCGWFGLSRVHSMAKATEALYVAVADRLVLDADRAARARRIEIVIMPLRCTECEEEK